MGRLFKTYYVGLLSHHAKEDIQQAERVTTITTLATEAPLVSRPRRESQSRASNSNPSDSEQDIRSQSQSRDSDDLDLSDTEIRLSMATEEDENNEDMDVENVNPVVLSRDESPRPLVAASLAAASAIVQDDIDEQADDEGPMGDSSGVGDEDEGEDIEIEILPHSGFLEETEELSLNRKGKESLRDLDISGNKLSSEDLRERVLKKRLQGNDQIMVCKCCGTQVTHKHDQIADCFQGQTGSACLYGAAMNVTLGRKSRRDLLSGAHDVADVFCGQCGQLLGWTYFLALDEKHRYKVGTYCFEDALLSEERQFLDLASRARDQWVLSTNKENVMSCNENSDGDDQFEMGVFGFYRGEVSVNSLDAIRRVEDFRHLL